ncbi:helix-turn-helix transcriptional regulator [Dermabacteraceae bacterium P7006]
MAESFLSVSDVAKLIGVKAPTLSRYRLPEPDALIGIAGRPVRGWRRETIEEWNANRPGKGGRPRTQTQNPQD